MKAHMRSLYVVVISFVAHSQIAFIISSVICIHILQYLSIINKDITPSPGVLILGSVFSP